MNRRDFMTATGAVAAASVYPSLAPLSAQTPYGPTDERSYIEPVPVAAYRHPSPSAYEAFQDMKFGIRIHWGIYSIWHRGRESWPFLDMSLGDRQRYNHLYEAWNPAGFDADAWMSIFADSGMKMFAFTTKHHEGFSMFDTRTRVRNRANWTAPGGPRIEECDLAYSIMETPFRRDVVKELCDAAHKRNLKIDLYFSHPDWYDADFRPYQEDPLQVPSAAALLEPDDLARVRARYGSHPVIVPDPTDAQVRRMMARHRAQLLELLTNYGTIDMMCLDMALGRRVWPELRQTLLKIREFQPNVMLRNRGIGCYGDYVTPERAIPDSNQEVTMPWFCIYPLGTDFSFEPDGSKYKGTGWIVHSLADTVSKGGGLMIGVGPSAYGEFHPEAIRQMKATGRWLDANGEAIYGTRTRDGALKSEGDTIRYTRSKDGRFVYAILIEWPGPEVVLRSVHPAAGTKVSMLGSNADLVWNFDSATGTKISLPENLQQAANRPCDYAWTLRFAV